MDLMADRRFCGYRASISCHIFTCGCGCGGHVAIHRDTVGLVGMALQAQQDLSVRLTKREGEKVTAAWGTAYFVEGHQPLGVTEARTGKRVALHGNT